MKRHLLLCLLLSIVFIVSIGCKRPNGNISSSDIILEPGETNLTFADIMRIDSWLEIKADSSLYVGNVKKIDAFESDYYILDNRNQNCVLRYSSDGYLINRIGTSGDGPGEYADIYDFTIDRKNKRVIILSSNSMIYTYNLDGDFLEKINLGNELLCNIAANDNGIMATTAFASLSPNGKKHLLYEFDYQLKPSGEWLPYSDPLQPPYPVIADNPLFSLGGNTYYFDNVNFIFYEYDAAADDVKTKAAFSLKNRMPKETYQNIMEFMSTQRDYNWIKDFIMTQSHYIVGYIFSGNYSIAVISNNGDTLKCGKYQGPFPQCFAMDDGSIISPITPDFYFNYWEKQNITKPAFDVNDDTNILIMKWHLGPIS